MAFQFRRGTEVERTDITPRPGEPLYVTDTGKVYIGDGTTEGGLLVNSELLDDLSPQLGGNLDLNGNNIVGTGDINITGTITATGDINLGDGVEDNVIVGGVIDSSLIPAEDDAYDLGDNQSSWRNGYFKELFVDTSLVADSIQINQIYASDSTALYSSDLDTLTISTVNGDLVGSVFGDDSAILVDSIDNKVLADIQNTITESDSVSTAVLRVQGVNQNGDRAGIEITTDGDSNDEYSLFNIEGYNESSTGQAIVYSRSRGSVESPNPLQQGDEILSQVWFGADSDTIPSFVAGIRVIVDKAPSTGVVPGSLELATTNDQGVPSLGLFIDSEQTSLFGGAAQLAAYADAASRDAAITTPAAGMLVFVEDISKFQGYDGTAWTDIN